MRDPQAPLLHADDLAVVRGDGVFETLLVRDGRPCLLEAHLARLTQSARMTDLPEPDLPAWRAAVATAASRVDRRRRRRGRAAAGVQPRAGERLARRTAVSRIDAARCPAGSPAARRDGVAALTLARGLPADGADDMPWLLAGAKTLSYAVNMAALRHAERHGAGDVVFVSSDGYILEGPRSTVVIATDTTAHVPADAAAVVSDPARHHAAGPVRGGPQQGLRLRLPIAAPADLVAAQGVWLVSSITLAARVHTLDGRPLRPAPLAAEVGGLVDAAIVSDR